MEDKFKGTLVIKLMWTINSIVFLFAGAAMLGGCFIFPERPTTVYGRVTDSTGAPVEGILVVFNGLNESTPSFLASMFSDSSGHYEIGVDIHTKFDEVDVYIPHYVAENPKFMKFYKGYDAYKNEVKMEFCCKAEVWEKTQYDFVLKSR